MPIDLRGDKLLTIRVFCRVHPLQRPRVAPAGHVYQPLDDQLELREELIPYEAIVKKPIAIPVVIDMVFYFSRGTAKQVYPTAPGYGDEDNLRKAMNDALAARGILENDRLVIGGSTWKLFGESDEAHVTVWKAGPKSVEEH